MEKTLLNIKNSNIKIKNKESILNYIENYGYFRIIECYGELAKKIKRKPNTNDIINIFKIDMVISNIIGAYILDFEKRLNTKIIDIIYKHNNIEDEYVLEVTNNPANSNLRNKGYSTFIKDLYENAKSCNLLNGYDNPKNVPLKKLSVSWSFHTLVSFIELQDEETKRLITEAFDLEDNIDEFVSVCHSIRKFRNIASHNGMFISTKLNYYRREFNIALNHWYKKNKNIDEDITISKLVLALEKLLNTNIKSQLLISLKRYKLGKKITKKIIEDITKLKQEYKL